MFSVVTIAACVLAAYATYHKYQSKIIDVRIPGGMESIIKRDDIAHLRLASKIEGSEWFYFQLQGDSLVSVRLLSDFNAESEVPFDVALDRMLPVLGKLRLLEFRTAKNLFSRAHLDKLKVLGNLKSVYLNSESLTSNDIESFCSETGCEFLHRTSWGYEFELYPFEITNFD